MSFGFSRWLWWWIDLLVQMRDTLGEKHGDHCADAAGMISYIPIWFWMWTSRKKPARLVMAFERARAEETPIPPPDMSSPRSSFANLSFINSISDKRHHKDCDLMISKVVLFRYFFEHIHYVSNTRFNSCSNATVVPEGCSLTPASLLNRDLGACSGGWSGALDPWFLKCILSSSTDPLSKVCLSSLLPELSDIPLPRTNRSRLQPLFRNLTIKGSSPNKAQRTEKATKSPKATWAPAPATAATSWSPLLGDEAHTSTSAASRERERWWWRAWRPAGSCGRREKMNRERGEKAWFVSSWFFSSLAWGGIRTWGACLRVGGRKKRWGSWWREENTTELWAGFGGCKAG